MRTLEGVYYSMIKNHVRARKPNIPFYSSVTGRLHACKSLEASYWVQNLVSPVLFNSAIQAVLGAQLEVELFLEIGPHSALAAPLRQILSTFQSQALYVPTMVRGRDCSESLLGAVGELHIRGIPVDFLAMNPNGTVLTDLPAYPWNHETKYWRESRICRDWRLRKFPQHELLGSRVMESTDLEPAWRNLLSVNDVQWLRDHKLHEDIVFPIAGYIAMVGEAIHQITGAMEYMLKDITVGNAMIFHDSNTIEIVSTFHPVRLTTTLESGWYDFSISSYSGSGWTKHCVGQARGGTPQFSPPSQRVEHLPRHVSSSKWYDVMNKAGLNYGRNLQGLREISSSTNEKIAVATISDSLETFDDSYPLHPAAIDSCLQLFSVAMTKGIPRLLSQLYVPTSIEEVHIGGARPDCSSAGTQFRETAQNAKEMSAPSADGILAKATVLLSHRSLVRGDITALAQGTKVMNMTGLGMSCLEDNNKTNNEAHREAVASLTWKPDIDFVESEPLIRSTPRERENFLLAEKLALLCMIEASDRFASTEVPSNHVGKYLSWLHLQKERAERGQYELVQGAEKFTRLDSPTRLSLIETIGKQIAPTKEAVLGNCILRVFGCFQDVYDGKTDPVEALLHDGALTGIYEYLAADYTAFLSLLSHKKPNLRILEIGAGTGGTTSAILDCLTSEFGERMYFEYHFTDISPGFFVTAQDRFKHAENIKYSVLDISKDPLTQGYEEGSFDLIVASNVSFPQ